MTPPVSTHSSQSRLSSLGSDTPNTIKQCKPKPQALTAFAEQKTASNPLRAPPDAMSDTEPAYVGGLCRSVSLTSNKSSATGPQPVQMSDVAPFAHTEPAQTFDLDLLTPGGVACAELTLQSFTAVYRRDVHHYSPEVKVWVVTTVKCAKYKGGRLVNYIDGTDSMLKNHAQIANLRLGISPPEAFEVISVLGSLQRRQILPGKTWSVIFELRPVGKFSVPPNTKNDRLTEAVEEMLKPAEEIVVNVQYSHHLFPTTTSVQESSSCPISPITEFERRHRQLCAKPGHSHLQRGTSILTTNADLDRDLQKANAICEIFIEDIKAKLPKNSKASIKYTSTIRPAKALQLLHDFRDPAGSTLPQDVKKNMNNLEEIYKHVRKERQEGSFTRTSLKAVVEMGGRIARRAIPTSSTFSDRYSRHAPSRIESIQPLNGSRYAPENSISRLAAPTQQPLRTEVSRRNAFELDRADYTYQATLKDITNGDSRRRGVGRLIDTLPIAWRRKNARTDTTEKEPDL
jgi:hypothetical protein